jgi:hypothetical protein
VANNVACKLPTKFVGLQFARSYYLPTIRSDQTATVFKGLITYRRSIRSDCNHIQLKNMLPIFLLSNGTKTWSVTNEY